MSLLARMMFAFARWQMRRSLATGSPDPHTVGQRGESLAYWYLRRLGYVMVARNLRFPDLPGEIDLVGFDGPVLAFIEVKTRTGDEAAPEQAVTPEKRRALNRMARAFCRRWRLEQTPWRFDVVALIVRRGEAPQLRLHRDAFRT